MGFEVTVEGKELLFYGQEINMSFALMFACPLQDLEKDQAWNILLRTK